MTKIQGGIEKQLETLTGQVEVLQKKVDHLFARLSTLEKGERLSQESPELEKTISSAPQVMVEQEGVLKKAGTGSLLPRVATVCFVMVFALILRTITDSGIINIQLGSTLGMGYAAALVIGGWLLYSRNSRLAPVFPACGLLLLFSVVLESQARFQSLSTEMAYIILFAACAVVVVLGLRFRAPAQLSISVIGSGLVGLSIDFPNLLYPMLAILLFGGVVAAYAAERAKLGPWLRWVTLGLSFIFWLFWSFKLNAPAVCDEPTAEILYLAWFYPMLTLLWTFYTATNIHRIATDADNLGFYESLLPTFSGVGAFLVSRWVVVPWYGSTFWLGLAGVLAAFFHFGAGAWLASRNREGARGSTTYTFAGVMLLGLGAAALFTDLFWAVPVLSVAAYLLARVASSWQSGGMRCTSYLFQLAAGLVAVISGVVATDTASPLAGSLVIATLMAMSFLQYRWCRNNVPPVVHSAFFSWLDRKDFSAVILLLTSLISGFFLLRLGLYHLLARSSADFTYMFRGGQTVFINLGAVLLLLVASSRKNSEILTVAIIVGLIGMFKSFVFDLFGIKGMPLVFSVFSSGIVATVGSVVSSRWQVRKTKAVLAPEPGPVNKAIQ